MKIIPTAIADALIIEPQVFGDQCAAYTAVDKAET
jgi:hypothetical protein